jgi:hypothetical protein
MSNDGFPMIYAFVVDSHSLIYGCFKSPYTLRMLFHIQFPIESFCPLYTSPITSKFPIKWWVLCRKKHNLCLIKSTATCLIHRRVSRPKTAPAEAEAPESRSSHCSHDEAGLRRLGTHENRPYLGVFYLKNMGVLPEKTWILREKRINMELIGNDLDFFSAQQDPCLEIM